MKTFKALFIVLLAILSFNDANAQVRHKHVVIVHRHRKVIAKHHMDVRIHKKP